MHSCGQLRRHGESGGMSVFVVIFYLFIFQVDPACTATIAPVGVTIASGDQFPIGTTSLTFRATADGGVTADCSLDVVVTDAENPVPTCDTQSVPANSACVGSATITTTVRCSLVALCLSTPAAGHRLFLADHLCAGKRPCHVSRGLGPQDAHCRRHRPEWQQRQLRSHSHRG